MEENNKSYFGGIRDGLRSLVTGLGVTLREYFTPKVTEQYPENRKTTLHVAKRHRGRLMMKRDGTIKIVSEMVTNDEGKKKRQLVDYQYDLGDCMFCQLCVNACNFDAIDFTNDFENAVFDRDKLVLHLNKEHYKSSLPNILDGGAPEEIGTFNTKTK